MSTSSTSPSASPSSVVSIDESPPQPGWQLRDLERREKQREAEQKSKQSRRWVSPQDPPPEATAEEAPLLIAMGKTHQAIKPKKVVLTAEQKEAKVIDFGNKRMEQHKSGHLIADAWGEFIPKTYLPQKVKGINGKNYPIIKSMDDAFAVAEYHNFLCWSNALACSEEEPRELTPVGGITLVKGGYDLRKSSKPIAEKTSGKGKDLNGAMGSWVFDFEKAETVSQGCYDLPLFAEGLDDSHKGVSEHTSMLNTLHQRRCLDRFFALEKTQNDVIIHPDNVLVPLAERGDEHGWDSILTFPAPEDNRHGAGWIIKKGTINMVKEAKPVEKFGFKKKGDKDKSGE